MPLPINRTPSKLYVKPNNNELIQVKGLYFLDPSDATETPSYFGSGASVKATLLDPNGQPVLGCNGLTLNYLSGTNGNFAGLVTQPFSPALGSGYVLFVVADEGGAHGEINVEVEVTTRRK